MELDEKKLIEIIELMPDNLTDMQKVRYIYIEVCRFFVYNPDYITGDDEKKAELFDEDVDINDITNNKAICSKLSRVLCYLLQACGIECNGVYFNGRQEGHMETVFRLEDKIYELNPAIDLMNVKIGYKTRGFAKPMKSNSSEYFKEYSYLNDNEIEELDNAIGYTFGLSKNYVDTITKKGECREDFDYKMYMDEAVDEIGDALHDYNMFKEYLKVAHPEENIDLLSAYEFDKYRIEFLMNYVNNFAKDCSYIDKRDFFESLIDRAIECRDEDLKLFSGTDQTGEMYTILKYEGNVADNDLFYLIKEGEDIKLLSIEEVKEILDNGFKTIAKGKERYIIRKDSPFQRASYEYGQEINMYIMSAEDENEIEERANQVFAVLLLQRLRKVIADYKEKLYEYAKVTDSHLVEDIESIYDGKSVSELNNQDILKSMFLPMFNSFVEQVNKYEYSEFFDEEDFKSDSMKGLQNFYANMKKLEVILEEQAEPIIEIIESYKAALKEEAILNNIKLYHVSTIPPEKMGGSLKPHYAKTQYHQNFDKVLCASTESVEANPYIMARVNGNGMYRLPLGIKSYILSGNNVSVEKDDNGNLRAISKVPGYIYYMPIEDFEPMVLLKYNDDTGEYFFEFDQEWTTNHEIQIPNKVTEHIGKRGDTSSVSIPENESEVYSIESYTDVTNILEHNQIAINKDLNTEDMKHLSSNRYFNNMNVQSTIINMIQAGRIRYLNGEVGINVYREAQNAVDKPVITYDGKQILEGPQTVSAGDIGRQKIKLREFVKNAISSGIKYGDYMEIMNHSNEDKSDNHDEQLDPDL